MVPTVAIAGLGAGLRGTAQRPTVLILGKKISIYRDPHHAYAVCEAVYLAERCDGWWHSRNIRNLRDPQFQTTRRCRKLRKNFLPLPYVHITHSSTTAVSAIKIFFLRRGITSPHPLAVAADCRKALHCQAAYKAAIALVIMGPYDYKLPPSAFVWSKAHIAQCLLSINNNMTLNRQRTCKRPVCWHQILLAKVGAEHAVPMNCLEKNFLPLSYITYDLHFHYYYSCYKNIFSKRGDNKPSIFWTVAVADCHKTRQHQVGRKSAADLAVMGQSYINVQKPMLSLKHRLSSKVCFLG